MGSMRLVTAATVANPTLHDLFLDDSGQIEWIGGDINEAESYARMVAQRILCRILLVRQEWYLDQREGTPWRESIWRKGTTAATLKAVLSDVIEHTPGVQDLRTIDVTLNATARSATVEFEAVSDMQTMVTSAMLDAPIIVDLAAIGAIV
jgi:hypothetical protein